MSKLEQILKIDPAYELRFKGPFTEVVSSTIKLHNPTDKKVCFKVKTTAPKKYCVRPNSGFVLPQTTVAVAVMLQPHDFDPKEKSKHKFMVQSMIASGNTENFENIWKDANPEQIMDSKLKCVFDLPEEHVAKGDSAIQNLETSKDSTANIESNISKTVNQSNVSKEMPAESDKLRTETKPSSQPLATNDVTLKAEILKLKEENERLKDEVRQRTSGMKPNISTPQEVEKTLQPNSESESQFPPILYLIVALICGIIIGKIVF